jgi:hypothetical protein
MYWDMSKSEGDDERADAVVHDEVVDEIEL